MFSEESSCTDTRPPGLPSFCTESAATGLLRLLVHMVHCLVRCPVNWRGKERSEESLPFTSFQRDRSLCRLPESPACSRRRRRRVQLSPAPTPRRGARGARASASLPGRRFHPPSSSAGSRRPVFVVLDPFRIWTCHWRPAVVKKISSWLYQQGTGSPSTGV